MARMVFFLHFLLSPPSEQMLGIPWGPCDLESDHRHPGTPWEGPCCLLCWKSTSAAEDQGVGTGLGAGGVLLVGAEQQHLTVPWLCCTGLSSLSRRCTGPGNTARSTSKLSTFRLCPSAATGLGRAAEAPGEAQSRAGFPAAAGGTAGTESSSWQAQCQSFPLLLCWGR